MRWREVTSLTLPPWQLRARRRAVGIAAIHHPLAAGHFERAVSDLAAVVPDAADGGGDVGNAEVDAPVRRRVEAAR